MPTTTSSELTQTVEVTIPPTIRFTSHVDGQIFLRGQYASFSYDVVDSDGSVVEVAMYINGGIFLPITLKAMGPTPSILVSVIMSVLWFSPQPPLTTEA
jgi:hypothetical protein